MIGKKLYIYETVDTVMDIAHQKARAGEDEGTVILAKAQKKGRGRLGRKWVSYSGAGLYFAIILKPDIKHHDAPKVTLLSALSVAEVLKKSYRLNAHIRWPNDVLIGDKKVAGMLADTQTESDLISRCNLGIGINVNNRPDVPDSYSLADMLGRSVSRKDLLMSFLEELERTMDRYTREDLVSEWKSLSSTIGRRVKIATPRGSVTGKAVDVDSTGALVVEEGDHRHILYYGDCHHIGR